MKKTNDHAEPLIINFNTQILHK